MASYAILGGICGPGDHIIFQYPTFAQRYLAPHFNGIDFGLWRMRTDGNWIVCVDELAAMVRPNTRAIILNNPNSLSGAVLPREILSIVVDVAHGAGIGVFCDEVSRPLYLDPTQPQRLSLIPLCLPGASIVTGSLYKPFAVPGIRLGGVTTRNAERLRAVGSTAREYVTVGVSQPAIAPGPAVRPCRESVALLDGFVARAGARVRWVLPAGAGAVFIQVRCRDGTPVDVVVLCRRLAEAGLVGVVPAPYWFGDGDVGDLGGCVGISLGDPRLLRESLVLLERFIFRT